MLRHLQLAAFAPQRGPRFRGKRLQVSIAAVVQKTDNVLPCYVVVQNQIRPAIEQQTDPCEKTSGFKHALKWRWKDKEYACEGRHRSKRGAKNEAARQVLRYLIDEEASVLDPRQNGAIAQWAIGSISEDLDATLEVKDDESGSSLQQSHTCTWSCPQIEGEFVATGSARAATESRRNAFAALYQNLPPNLEEIYLQVKSESAANVDEAPQVRSNNRARYGEINAMHNTVIQKLNTKASWDFHQTSGGFECTLTWSFYDQSLADMQTITVSTVERSKIAAKATANQKMLILQGHLADIPADQQDAMDEIQQALKEQRVKDAHAKTMTLLEQAEPATWSFFLPHVFRAVLGEGDVASMHELLGNALRLSQESGMPIQLWESLLDEASFSVRHYFMASPALRQLGGASLADSFPRSLEKDYFRRFRHLLALERHGGLMHGIQQYELDPNALSGVPVVEVHQQEASQVVLTSPPGANFETMTEGHRELKPADLVLLVPSEAAEEVSSDEPAEMGNSTGWQHPEAWLACVTSLVGNPALEEEVKLHVRRISDFASDVKGPELDAKQPRISPITIGRQYRLYFLALETPMSRQLSALRNLTQVKLPVFSENFEGLKPTYVFSDSMREVILAEAEDARQLAEETCRGGLSPELALQHLERLAGQQPLVQSLTPSQRESVTRSLQQRLSLIQGPPGTGKTHVACAILAIWASIFGPLGERILAVADSNVAADNVYARLCKMGIPSVRVGQGKGNDYDLAAIRRQLQTATVVVATCIGSGTEILNTKVAGGSFQRVLVDECTQACEPAVLVALGRGCEQVVLIGDHAQLPATVLSKAASHEGLSTSLFERMASQNCVEPTILLEQRRMHSSIAEFPNRTFYGGRLENAADEAALTAIPGFPWPNPDCRVCFVDVAKGPSMLEGRRGFSAFNVAEAETLVDVLHSIVRAGYPEEQIVVLTAYLAQKQEIMRALRDRGLGRYLQNIAVDTIDGYQGMEQGLVLFSATRSNESRALGFLADNRRMNVMLTRAKQGLIVFGNADTLRLSEAAQSKWPDWLSWVEGKASALSADELAQRIQQHSSDTGSAASTTRMNIEELKKEDNEQPVADVSQRKGDASPTITATPVQARPTAWQQVYSEEYRAHYYWNTETNVTQWEQPTHFIPAS
ncbi:NAM7 [Symbiodinium natans]|uniref:NAM7 protein n=1 Tax=Symbiodinium natans TaxID=878477 RepID=A0A812MFI3_9DINO|nr:NAM7 [Symbiodinium natans]